MPVGFRPSLAAAFPLATLPRLRGHLAGQPHLLPHFADDGVIDRPFHPASRPRLVHGLGVGLRIALEKIPDEAGLALDSGLLLPCCSPPDGLDFVQTQLDASIGYMVNEIRTNIKIGQGLRLADYPNWVVFYRLRWV